MAWSRGRQSSRRSRVKDLDFSRFVEQACDGHVMYIKRCPECLHGSYDLWMSVIVM